MPRRSWKTIRSTADPETIANAEIKTAAILAEMDRDDHTAGGSHPPLPMKSMDLGFTREEIVSFVREGRDRPE